MHPSILMTVIPTWFKIGTREQLQTQEEPPVEIGNRFRYLDIQMICVRHTHKKYNGKVVVAEYIDKHDIFHRVIFAPEDYVALKKEMSLGFFV